MNQAEIALSESSGTVAGALPCWPSVRHTESVSRASQVGQPAALAIVEDIGWAAGCPTLDTDPVWRMLPPSGQCYKVQCLHRSVAQASLRRSLKPSTIDSE